VPLVDEGVAESRLRHRRLLAVAHVVAGASALFATRWFTADEAPQVSMACLLIVIAAVFSVASAHEVFERTLVYGGLAGWAIFAGILLGGTP
jgi:hypothetical protein